MHADIIKNKNSIYTIAYIFPINKLKNMVLIPSFYDIHIHKLKFNLLIAVT